MLNEYMIIYKNGFNGSNAYYKTHTEAIQAGLRAHATGLIPEAIYKYNSDTDRYDKLIGKFTVATKEA